MHTTRNYYPDLHQQVYHLGTDFYTEDKNQLIYDIKIEVARVGNSKELGRKLRKLLKKAQSKPTYYNDEDYYDLGIYGA